MRPRTLRALQLSAAFALLGAGCGGGGGTTAARDAADGPADGAPRDAAAGDAAPDDAPRDAAAGDAAPDQVPADAPPDDAREDVAPADLAADRAAGDGAVTDGQPTDAAADGPPGSSAWVCDFPPNATPPGVVLGTCAASGLLDLEKAPVTAADINDRGDVLLGGRENSSSTDSPVAMWLGSSSCLLELPDWRTAAVLHESQGPVGAAALNRRSSAAVTTRNGAGDAEALLCNDTCRSLPDQVTGGGVRVQSWAMAVNDADQVAGMVTTTISASDAGPSSTTTHAYLWDPARTPRGRDLGTLPAGGRSYAVDINRAGQVLGNSGQTTGGTTPPTGVHAFLWDSAGGMRDLGTLGGLSARATAMNDAAQVVGISQTAANAAHAFLWDAGTMRDLGTLGGAASIAVAINARGQVTGTSNTAAGDVHAFIWEAGVMRDLGTLGGSASTPGPPDPRSDWVTRIRGFAVSSSTDSIYVTFPLFARHAINDAGQIVGTSLIASGQLHAFSWEAGTMRDLGTLGGPYSIGVAVNAAGQVVGYGTVSNAADPLGRTHAFLYAAGRCPAAPGP